MLLDILSNKPLLTVDEASADQILWSIRQDPVAILIGEDVLGFTLINDPALLEFL